MKNLITLICLVFSFALSTHVSAQKFGYVNTQELLQGLPSVKEANVNIETYRNQLLKKGQEMLQSLQSKYQTLEQTRDNYSPKQLETEVSNLKAEEQKIMEFEQNSQQQIIEKSETLLKPIRDKIQKAIDDVATENGYTYIFDFSTGFVLFADPTSDVSGLVKAKLGI